MQTDRVKGFEETRRIITDAMQEDVTYSDLKEVTGASFEEIASWVCGEAQMMKWQLAEVRKLLVNERPNY